MNLVSELAVCSGSYLSQSVGSVVGLQQRSSPSSSPSGITDVTVLVHRLGQSHLDRRSIHQLEGGRQKQRPENQFRSLSLYNTHVITLWNTPLQVKILHSKQSNGILLYILLASLIYSNASWLIRSSYVCNQVSQNSQKHFLMIMN